MSASPPEPPASVIAKLQSSPLVPKPPSSCGDGDMKVVAPANKVTIIRAADVSADYKKMASAWPVWESKTHPQKPKGSGKFPFNYNGDYDTERVLIISGRATLTPLGQQTATQLTIEAGDAVYFHRGFKCLWEVHEPMTKYYAYFGDDGNELVDDDEPPPAPPPKKQKKKR